MFLVNVFFSVCLDSVRCVLGKRLTLLRPVWNPLVSQVMRSVFDPQKLGLCQVILLGRKKWELGGLLIRIRAEDAKTQMNQGSSYI